MPLHKKIAAGKYKRTPEFWKSIRLEELQRHRALDVDPWAKDHLDSAMQNKESYWVLASQKLAMHIIRRLVEFQPINTTFSLMTAQELVGDYVHPEFNKKWTSLTRDVLYLLAGYSELPNKALPGLVRRVALERHRLNRKTVIFSPTPNMDQVWGVDTTQIVMQVVGKNYHNYLDKEAQSGPLVAWTTEVRMGQA